MEGDLNSNTSLVKACSINVNILQAQYWHDPLAEQEYRDNSLFLADINNEGPVKNQTYKENLAALDNLVLVQFTEDTIVDPKQSEGFGWFSAEDNTVMVPVQVMGVTEWQ